MMTDKSITGTLTGFNLAQEEETARAARLDLERQGESPRRYNLATQRGERIVKIRCGADIKPQPIGSGEA